MCTYVISLNGDNNQMISSDSSLNILFSVSQYSLIYLIIVWWNNVCMYFVINWSSIVKKIIEIDFFYVFTIIGIMKIYLPNVGFCHLLLFVIKSHIFSNFMKLFFLRFICIFSPFTYLLILIDFTFEHFYYIK